MFKHATLFISLVLVSLSVKAQTPGGIRYKDVIFPDVQIDKDLSYDPNAVKEEKKWYQFDLYQPKNDDASNRPLIIWMHGGGFKFGSKNAKGMKIWGESFAKRGYVCAAINYRLSKHNPLFHFDELLKSSYYAVQDAKRAVLYFK